MSRDPDPSAEHSLSLIADCLDALVDKVDRVADELAALRKPRPADIHRQAMLAAALVAAEVRDEAEDDRAKAMMAGWYQAADKVARRILDLANKPPSENG